jgi:hypothetical protein
MSLLLRLGRFDQVNRVPFHDTAGEFEPRDRGGHEPIAHIRRYWRALCPPANVEINPISVETTINKTEEWSPRANPQSSVLCAVVFEVIHFAR